MTNFQQSNPTYKTIKLSISLSTSNLKVHKGRATPPPLQHHGRRHIDGLVSLGFDVISVEQVTATRQSPSEGSTIINLPLYVITLPTTAKFQYIF
jgi:hypothetical protein